MTYNVEIERGTDAYRWDLRAAPSSATDLPSVCTGTHLAGPVALADGTGQLDISLDDWADLDGVVGSLSSQYDLTDGQKFRIEIDGLGGPDQRAEDGSYYFRHQASGGGDFQYRTTILLDDQYDGVLEVRTRWQSNRSGRSDAVVYIDALETSFRFSQCFTRSDRFAWRSTDYDAGFEAGDERLWCTTRRLPSTKSERSGAAIRRCGRRRRLAVESILGSAYCGSCLAALTRYASALATGSSSSGCPSVAPARRSCVPALAAAWNPRLVAQGPVSAIPLALLHLASTRFVFGANFDEDLVCHLVGHLRRIEGMDARHGWEFP